MGGEFNYTVFETDDQQRIKTQFRDICEDARHESGNGGYTGTFAEMSRVGVWRNLKLDTMDEAIGYLEDHHNKWDQAMAVSFMMPTEPDRQQLERIKAAEEKVKRWRARLNEAEAAINQRFLDRKSSTVGCSKCGSRFGHEALSSKIRDFRRRYEETGVLVPACPLCRDYFINTTEGDKITKLHARLQLVLEELAEAQRPKPSTKIGYVVGGWCSS